MSRVASLCLAVVIVMGAGAAHAAVDENSAGLVTELVTGALGKEPRLEVISSADVRRQLELEANKQAIGCDATASSCLAEIAGAMGAQLVVYGKLGELDDVVILTLNLFDSTQGRAVARVSTQEPNLKALSTKIDVKVQELVGPFVKNVAEGTTTKLLVLDIEAPKGKTAAVVVDPAPPPAPGNPLFAAGLVGVIGGVVVGGVGAALFFGAAQQDSALKSDRSIDAVRANELYDFRDGLGAGGVVGMAAGGLALATGAVLLGASAVGE